MKVTVLDEVGMGHDTDATLMGMCSEGHDIYMVIVPFPVNTAHPPSIEFTGVEGTTHVKVVGMGFDGSAYEANVMTPKYVAQAARYRRLAVWVIAINLILMAIDAYYDKTAWFIMHGVLAYVAWRFMRMIDRHQP